MTAPVADRTATPERIEADDASTVDRDYWSDFMHDARTGAARATYESDWIGLVDATSDDVFNRVDLRYIHLHGCVWATGREPPREPSIADLVRDLRDRIDLPAEDVAAMVGVRRRQLYNLISGQTPSPHREEQIRLLHRVVEDLHAAVGGDRSRLRAAILMPVGDRFETLHGAAESGDLGGMRAIVGELLSRIEAGEIGGLIQRPAPHLRRLVRPGASERVRDHLRGQASPLDGEGDGADS